MGRLGAAFRRGENGEAAWDDGVQPPAQGEWTEADYFDLTSCNSFIEFNNGTIQYPSLPTARHQRIVANLTCALGNFLEPRGGAAWLVGLSVRTLSGVIRMPDVVAMLDKHDNRAGERVFDGADLLVEVVSDDSDGHKRDYEDKRKEYAAAGIPEYWIVDPIELRITVLRLDSAKYTEYCVAGEGETAVSALLDGFSVEATKVFHRD